MGHRKKCNLFEYSSFCLFIQVCMSTSERGVMHSHLLVTFQSISLWPNLNEKLTKVYPQVKTVITTTSKQANHLRQSNKTKTIGFERFIRMVLKQMLC